MHLIIGGVHQGKLEYAKNTYKVGDKEILDCSSYEGEELFNIIFGRKKLKKYKIIYGLEKFSLFCVRKDLQAAELFEKHIQRFNDKILICADISEGVVPLEKEERAHREMNGRMCIYLSSVASKVTRIFCGLAHELKKGHNSKIYLLRHGKTEGNAKRWYYGITDLPLLQEGKEELKKMVSDGVYEDIRSNHYYTSGMKRANETMDIVFGKLPREIVKNLEERDFGSFEKHTHEELLSNTDYQTWITDQSETDRPGGVESMTMFRQRIRSGFEELLALHMKRCEEEKEEERNSVCVCHAGAISCIIMYLFDPNGQNFYAYTPDTGRGYAIDIENGVPVGYSKI